MISYTVHGTLPTIDIMLPANDDELIILSVAPGRAKLSRISFVYGNSSQSISISNIRTMLALYPVNVDDVCDIIEHEINIQIP